MSTFQKKSFDAPDETRTPPSTKLEIVKFGDMSVLKMTCEPGWKWSKHIRPIAGTESCQGTHFGYVISGRSHLVMDDGTETDLGPGDIVMTPAGHDGWVIGDEPYVFLDFQDASRNVYEGEHFMSVEENKASVRRLYEEVFNKKNLAAIDDCFAPSVIDHSLPPGVPGGIEGVRQTIAMFLGAFPDLNFTLEDMVAEGDKIVVCWTMRGTHQGASLGMPPTGKQVTMPGISNLRLDGGKAVETWVIYDQLSMLQQLGLAPAPAHASS